MRFCLFFFNDTATTEIYTLSLHDALPISRSLGQPMKTSIDVAGQTLSATLRRLPGDRKSTRLNSSHQIISYAVFCLKKKKRLRSMQSRDNGPDSLHRLAVRTRHHLR